MVMGTRSKIRSRSAVNIGKVIDYIAGACDVLYRLSFVRAIILPSSRTQRMVLASAAQTSQSPTLKLVPGITNR